MNLSPCFCAPVEDAESVEPSLVGSTSSEHDQFIIDSVEMSGAVGTVSRHISSSLDIVPGHGVGIEGP
jgi:hypothetical protein